MNNQQSESKLKKSLPNILTILRIVIIPVLVIIFYVEGNDYNPLAATLFVLASITDFFDGYLARLWKSQSNFGRFLDPIADKLLVATAILILVHYDRADIIPAIAIICREILVSGLREFLAELRVSVPVSKLAKIKTSVQMLALFLLILGPREVAPDASNIIILLGNIALWIAAALTVITGYIYLKEGLKHMGEKDK